MPVVASDERSRWDALIVKVFYVKAGELFVDAQFVYKVTRASNGRATIEVQSRDDTKAEWIEDAPAHKAKWLTTRAKSAM